MVRDWQALMSFDELVVHRLGFANIVVFILVCLFWCARIHDRLDQVSMLMEMDGTCSFDVVNGVNVWPDVLLDHGRPHMGVMIDSGWDRARMALGRQRQWFDIANS